jgi:hypothetical protein
MVLPRFARWVLLGLVLSSSAGCGGTMVHVNPSPVDAKVYLDGTPQGKGPTDVELMNDEQTYSLRVGGIGGYFDQTTEITSESASPIDVALLIDNSFAQTVDGEGELNQWLTIQVAKHYDEDDAWRKVTRAITAAISDFKTFDRDTFSLQTEWQIAGKRGDWRRTASRIVIRPGSREAGALSVRFMIEARLFDAKRKKAGDAERTFRPFLDALAEARERLVR